MLVHEPISLPGPIGLWRWLHLFGRREDSLWSPLLPSAKGNWTEILLWRAGMEQLRCCFHLNWFHRFFFHAQIQENGLLHFHWEECFTIHSCYKGKRKISFKFNMLTTSFENCCLKTLILEFQVAGWQKFCAECGTPSRKPFCCTAVVKDLGLCISLKWTASREEE